MREIKPLACCAEYAVETGRKPSMKILCKSCDDYRSYMEHIRYPVKVNYHSFDGDPAEA